MTVFRFAHPAALLLLIVPVVLFLLSRRNRWTAMPPVMRYSDTRLFSNLPVGWRVRGRRLPDGLRLTAWILLVIALARPQSGQAREVIRGQGIDIVLALDISGSMVALDFEPQNRLEAAKSVIQNFIDEREFDRIGLVVFARNAFQQSPPTLDYRVLKQLLSEVRLGIELNLRDPDGTAIGLALVSAANMLRSSEATSRVIVLLTDGDNNAGLDPLMAAQAVALLGIRVYTIGMGKTGLVPVPDRSGTIQYLESDLDEVTLQSIASIAGGLYFRAENLEGLRQIYDEINRLVRSDVSRQVFVRWQDQAAVWLVSGAVLLVLERLLRHSVFQTVP